MAKKVVFFDLEVNERNKVSDYGAVNEEGQFLHTTSKSKFSSFFVGADYICGHNIINARVKS